jgi:hypothetical protein
LKMIKQPADRIEISGKELEALRAAGSAVLNLDAALNR